VVDAAVQAWCIWGMTEIEFTWSGFRVEARDEGGVWRGELYESENTRPTHAFEVDVHRSLDNMIGLFGLPNRLELAQRVALEAAQLRRQQRGVKP
jgi:hypothetical protein